MKAIELYKFIEDNNVEWHYQDNDGVEDVIIFPYTFDIKQFTDLLSCCTLFDDGGIEIRLMDGYIAVWMDEICEHYGIELSEVFDKEKDK